MSARRLHASEQICDAQTHRAGDSVTIGRAGAELELDEVAVGAAVDVEAATPELSDGGTDVSTRVPTGLT